MKKSNTNLIHDLFEKNIDEHCKFENLKNPRSKRPDLHAFLLLDELQPNNRDIIMAAEHDEIYLEIDLETLIITEEQVIELLQCGVSYDSSRNCFYMFV